MIIQKRVFLIFIFVVFSLFFSCSKAPDTVPSAVSSDSALHFGYVPGNLNNTFQDEFVHYLQAACDSNQIQLEVLDGNNDVACQNRIIQTWKSEGIDAILCSPIDPIQLQASLDACMDDGIPVINLDSECERSTVYIGADQYLYGRAAGTIAGQWLNSKIPNEPEVLCAILVKSQSLAMIERQNGIIDALIETCPRAKVVSIKRYTDPASAYTDMVEILQDIPNLKCLIGMADFAVLSAYEAVLDAPSIPEDLCLFGLDATKPMLEKIAEGTIIRGTVSQNTEFYANTVIEMAKRALEGNAEARILLDVTPVTIDNVQDYLP